MFPKFNITASYLLILQWFVCTIHRRLSHALWFSESKWRLIGNDNFFFAVNTWNCVPTYSGLHSMSVSEDDKKLRLRRRIYHSLSTVEIAALITTFVGGVCYASYCTFKASQRTYWDILFLFLISASWSFSGKALCSRHQHWTIGSQICLSIAADHQILTWHNSDWCEIKFTDILCYRVQKKFWWCLISRCGLLERI